MALAACAVFLASPALSQEAAETPAPPPRAAKLALTYNSDGMDVVHGGLRQGQTYDGRLGLILDLDLDELVGWTGGTAHASVHQIHGRQPTAEHLGALMAVSNVEAEPATRLFNLWVEQKLNDRTSVRAGQFTAGQEFFISQTAALFVNATFGWPAILSANLPSGGPAYPLSTPGARLSYQPTPSTTVLLAVFNGDPAGPGADDPQQRDRSGFNSWRISGPPFLMAEAQFTHGAAAAPTRVVRVGAWTDRRATDSQRYDDQGLPLADPLSTGVPRRLSGQWGAYVILDQRLVQRGQKTLMGFVRVAATQSDRTLVSAYADLGFTYAGLLPGRPNDTLGLAAAYSGISKGARGFDADVNHFSGVSGPVRDHEVAVELTYQLAVTAKWSLQPNLQYIAHPGGGVAGVTGARVPNAIVLGLRSSARF